MKKLQVLSIVMAMTVTLVGCAKKDAAPTPAASTEATKAPVDAPKATDALKAKEFQVSLRHINIRDSTKPRQAVLLEAVKAAKTAIPGLKFELGGMFSLEGPEGS